MAPERVPGIDSERGPKGGKVASKPADPLVAALGWMTDRLATALPEEKEPPSLELDWGADAASYPPAYWHWLLLHRLRRDQEPQGSDDRRLPPTGPLLSVVVPVYRPSHWYFRACVRSVIDQSYQSWELCLSDDGSGDPHLSEMIAEFASADTRIKAISAQTNGGISRATNRALEKATGEFVVLLDHDDVIEPDCLAEIAAVIMAEPEVDVVYSDEDKLDELDRRYMPHFKPDWDPDLLLSYPYMGHVTAIRRELLDRIGHFRPEFDGSQDYDVMLRATEVARQVAHIPKVLYHWRVVAGSAAGDTDAKPWAHAASKRVIVDTLRRRATNAIVTDGPFQGSYHVRRKIEGTPTVSIIMPFRDQAALTVSCLASLDEDPGYPIGEVVLVDNGSIDPETWELRRRLESRPATRVLEDPGPFNWAAINNAAAATCSSDMLLFLNNDIKATTGGWLKALVEQGERSEVGAVGARLVYPDGKLQHAGVVIGLGGIASHLFIGMPKDKHGYFHWDQVVREYSAVTAACMLVRREVFEELGGFDESFVVGFNDVDFCIRLERAGYRIVYTPHAELTHYESISRGQSGFYRDYQRFLRRWSDVLRKEDPHYNPNLSRLEHWCSLRPPDEDEKWLELVDGLKAEQVD